MSHTYAILTISREAYDEIASKLREAGYDHAFDEDGVIDMHGIGLEVEKPKKDHDELDNPIDAAFRNALNEVNQAAGTALDETLRERFNLRMGFVVMSFTLGPAGVMTYVSNARREDMRMVLKEFLDRWERQDG